MFKVNDNVFSKRHGNGVVVAINENELYSVEVAYPNNDLYTYGKNGEWEIGKFDADVDINLNVASNTYTDVKEPTPNVKFPQAYIQGLQFCITQLKKDAFQTINNTTDITIDRAIDILQLAKDFSEQYENEVRKIISSLKGIV